MQAAPLHLDSRGQCTHGMVGYFLRVAPAKNSEGLSLASISVSHFSQLIIALSNRDMRVSEKGASLCFHHEWGCKNNSKRLVHTRTVILYMPALCE